MWGAVGWGVMAIVAGYLIDLASMGKAVKDYTSSFILVFIMLTLDAVSVLPIKVCLGGEQSGE